MCASAAATGPRPSLFSREHVKGGPDRSPGGTPLDRLPRVSSATGPTPMLANALRLKFQNAEPTTATATTFDDEAASTAHSIRDFR